jgi:hypothetical protein
MIDEGDCGAIGGMKIGRGNRSTRRKPAPAPLCPPQIPQDLRRNPMIRLWQDDGRSSLKSSEVDVNSEIRITWYLSFKLQLMKPVDLYDFIAY